MPRGGYQTPSNPAPVSAPGRLSRRTDGGPAQTTTKMTGLPYGENADYNDMQSSAPLRATPGAAALNPSSASPTGGGSSVTPMFSQSSRPDEPVTAGAPFGPGDGPLGVKPVPFQRSVSDTLQMFADATGNRGLGEASMWMRSRGR